jgi:CheY-like chemotaxis protein/predicted regulator of Ras-like GTPase activity (Roadblock/LC7/MglB family)
MSQQQRILVVEGDEYLNQGIVNSLLKDGYSVQGVLTGAEAIRILWADEQNLVIGDLQLPDADGFDLLQWIRTYCPQTRMIMLAVANIPGARTRALENGAVGYLEKPVDLRLLKVEARRLLQQTGFTASLASFDLLDVIQIVNMSRKSISLVVHTGLEEQGMLGFQSGEMIWAEYGTLRGEEAFFALAAHKNGMVTQQPWDDRVMPNVMQPLSRLIMQALQYRSKYAAAQQLSGEYKALNTRLAAPVESSPSPVDMLFTEAIDDRPFTYVAGPSAAPLAASPSPPPPAPTPMPKPTAAPASQSAQPQPVNAEPREWWQDSAKTRSMGRSGSVQAVQAVQGVTGSGSLAHKSVPGDARAAASVNGSSITPSTVRKTPTGQRSDLPSWLMDQPTQSGIQALRPSALTGSGQTAAAPAGKPSPAEWQPQPGEPARPAEPLASAGSVAPVTAAIGSPASTNGNGKIAGQVAGTPERASNRAEWQAPQKVSADASPVAAPPLADASASILQSLVLPRQTDELAGRETNERATRGTAVATPAPVFVPEELIAPSREAERPAAHQQSASKRNYSSLVSALQTLGYTLPGFIASAIVGMDGQPIAQVAMEDQDISGMCGDFSVILKSALLVLQQGSWGQHDDTIITSATHHILLRVLDREREVFQVLITTRESDPVESLEVMATVESAIIAAL